VQKLLQVHHTALPSAEESGAVIRGLRAGGHNLRRHAHAPDAGVSSPRSEWGILRREALWRRGGGVVPQCWPARPCRVWPSLPLPSRRFPRRAAPTTKPATDCEIVGATPDYYRAPVSWK
jgi:hypothetical protein